VLRKGLVGRLMATYCKVCKKVNLLVKGAELCCHVGCANYGKPS
jgi:hypothetical protein